MACLVVNSSLLAYTARLSDSLTRLTCRLIRILCVNLRVICCMEFSEVKAVRFLLSGYDSAAVGFRYSASFSPVGVVAFVG